MHYLGIAILTFIMSKNSFNKPDSLVEKHYGFKNSSGQVLALGCKRPEIKIGGQNLLPLIDNNDEKAARQCSF